MTSIPSRAVGAIAVALATPALVTGLYLYLSRQIGDWSTDRDHLALACAVGVGLLGILWLPVGRVAKAAFAFAYVPLAYGGLLLFGLTFVCVAFGDCL